MARKWQAVGTGTIGGTIAPLPAASQLGRHVAVEIKRNAGIEAVEQLCRYLEYLNRDPMIYPVRGMLAAQTITPQARVLAGDRNIQCVVVDYDELRGLDSPEERLF